MIEPGPQRRQRAPQSLLNLWRLRRPLRREPGPQRRQRAPQPLLQSLETAPATAEGRLDDCVCDCEMTRRASRSSGDERE